MTAVQIHQVTKTFGNHMAVDDLSLQVPTGSVYGFIGPNGSGKTTTLRMIMRILHPDRGDIRVLGEHALGAASDRVGYLPEERGLYKQMIVRDSCPGLVSVPRANLEPNSRSSRAPPVVRALKWCFESIGPRAGCQKI